MQGAIIRQTVICNVQMHRQVRMVPRHVDQGVVSDGPVATLLQIRNGNWNYFPRTREKRERHHMLQWTITFLIVALIAGLLGFAGIAGAAAGIARVLFVIFLVLFLVSLIARKKA